MKGSLSFYPTTADRCEGRVSGTTGLLSLGDAYAPSLLIDSGDQEYLRQLARAANLLADAMDNAAQVTR